MSLSILRRTSRPVLLPVLLAGLLLLAWAVVASDTARGTPIPTVTGTHYVANDPHSQCSDAGPGTSATAPWCDFGNLNGQTFGPGAQILLRRGDTFTGELGKLYGSGTPAAPIVLGAYGSGARPHITGASQATDRAVWIQDGSYWTVRDLELSNVGAGLVFWYTTNGHAGLTVTDVYTHDVLGVFGGSPKQTDLPGMYHSAGILITGDVPVTASDVTVTGVTLTRLEGYNNNDDVDISGFNANSGGQQGFLSTALGHHSVSDVSLTDSYFHHNLSGENFDNLQNMTITGNRLQDTGHGGNPFGTTALFFWSSSTVTVADNMLAGEVSTNSPDQTETDLEAFDDHIAFRGNAFADSAGSPIEILEINGYTDNYQSSHEISDNLFLNYGGGAAVHDGTGGSARDFSGVARDNIYAAPESAFTDGLTGWTYTTQPVGYLDSDAHYTALAGATVTYGFTGTTVTWIGGRNSDHGRADVTVCDSAGDNCGPVTTVDTRAATSTPQQALYTTSDLTDTAHTLKITVRADTSGTGHYTDVDGFISGTAGQTREVNDTDSAITYSNPANPWIVTGNAAATPNSIYNAAYDFSPTRGSRQWHEQSYNPGLSWHDLACDAAAERCGHYAYVSRFAMVPGPGAAGSVARAWIAPSTGTVAIRGRVLREAAGGGNVAARITRNGKQIWPTTGAPQLITWSDTTGYPTDLTLPVNAGDAVRFEVSTADLGTPPGSPTAWVPTIAYQ